MIYRHRFDTGSRKLTILPNSSDGRVVKEVDELSALVDCLMGIVEDALAV